MRAAHQRLEFAFVGTSGRCLEQGFLEFHHVIPFADGGETLATNIQLRCRAHNHHEARMWFGADAVRERSPWYGNSVWTESMAS